MSFPRKRESHFKYEIPHQVRNDRFGESTVFSKVSKNKSLINVRLTWKIHI